MKIATRGLGVVGMAALVGCMASPVVEPGGTEGSSGSNSDGGAETGPVTGDPTADPSGVQTVTSASESDSGVPTEASTTGLTTTGEPTSTSETTGGPDTTVDPVDCAAVVDALVAAFTAAPHCDLALLFDEGGAALGYTVVCGEAPPMPYTEKSAVGATDCCQDDGSVLNDASPFVVYTAATAQTSGGLAIVSNAVGGRVFEITIGATRPGMISVPAALESIDGLAVGEGCSDSSLGLANAATYNAELGGNLGPEVVSMLVDTINTTALPAALVAGADVVDADLSLVVSYPSQYMAGGPVYLVVLGLSAP